jgi:hypothetical protein
MSHFESVTKLVKAVEYTDSRLNNCFSAIATEAVAMIPLDVLQDLLAAYFLPYAAAKDSGNKKLQSAIGRRWNVARTGTVRAMKEAGFTVKFPPIKKGGTDKIEIQSNADAAATATVDKEKQAAEDQKLMADAATAVSQQHTDAIHSMTLDKLANELERLIALSDHTPESVVAELVNRLTAADNTAEVWNSQETTREAIAA